ncbi:PTS transporter subunit EIIB, partial [Oceanivirga salmonicida]
MFGFTKKDNKDISKENLAQSILELLGGTYNINEVDSCITRLRIRVKDTDLIEKKEL